MNKFFYGSLAVNNIKKNAKGYVPYMLTCIFSIMFFFIMLNITLDPGVKEIIGGMTLQSLLGFGCIIIGIFAAIFLFYTNSVLIKQRKKELALYNILGMAKRHIGKMMFCETILMSAVSLAAGLLSGAILGKLVFLALLKLLHITVPMNYHLLPDAFMITAVVFGCIFFVVLLCNLGRVTISNPMELMGGSRQGEKEPKAKWILAVLGMIITGVGYYLAITVESPIQALLIFFIAVLLVIIGTYLLFIAGSIALLKLLKKNKHFYYKTKNFTAVSGMLYRMKRNAAGLASICILSTMVLVTVSTTVSMQIGLNDSINECYRNDLMIREKDAEQQEKLKRQAEDVLQKYGITMEKQIEYPYIEYTSQLKGNEITAVDYSTWTNSMVTLYFIPVEGSVLGRHHEPLQKDEMIISGRNPFPQDTLKIGEKTFRIKEKDSAFLTSPASGIMNDYHFVLVSDKAVLQEIQKQDAKYMKEAFYLGIDIPEDQEKTAQLAMKAFSKENDAFVIQKSQIKKELYSLYGGLLFIGIFLGLLFLMATVLIIYYKQISEGYEDQPRYQIMQKVGMSLKEVKQSIRSQILIVFFLPLAASVFHVAGAFNMMSKLLIALGIPNITLFIVCTAATILIFALFYVLVYSLTAKEYYKLVK